MAFYEPTQPYELGNVNGSTYHVVPPRDVSNDTDKKNMAVFDTGMIFCLKTRKYGNPEFVTEISKCQPLELDQIMLDWQYDQKNRAQDVLPFLFLGPMSAARDSDYIHSNGVTMLLAVRDGKAVAVNPKIMNPTRFASAQHIETATFDIIDELDLAQRFPSAVKTMIDHLETKTNGKSVTRLGDVKGRILVFCEAGDRRSAAVVILFLMVVFGLPTVDAIQAVQARRYGISINGDWFRMIKTCGEMILAEGQVAIDSNSFAIPGHSKPNRSQKRNMDQAWQEDEEMGDLSDEDERWRIGTAPFKDLTK